MTLNDLTFLIICLDIGIKFKTSSTVFKLVRFDTRYTMGRAAKHAMSQYKTKTSNNHCKLKNDKKWISLKAELFSIYPKVCMKCGTSKGQIHADHIKPKSKYPELKYEIDNLQVLCKKCNFKKAAIDETDYRPYNHPSTRKPQLVRPHNTPDLL